MHVNLKNKKGFCNFNQNVIIFSASGGGKNYNNINISSNQMPL